MKTPDESTGRSGGDAAPPEAASSGPGRNLFFPVFNRLRHGRHKESAWLAIPDAELLNDSGMKESRD